LVAALRTDTKELLKVKTGEMQFSQTHLLRALDLARQPEDARAGEPLPLVQGIALVFLFHLLTWGAGTISASIVAGISNNVALGVLFGILVIGASGWHLSRVLSGRLEHPTFVQAVCGAIGFTLAYSLLTGAAGFFVSAFVSLCLLYGLFC